MLHIWQCSVCGARRQNPQGWALDPGPSKAVWIFVPFPLEVFLSRGGKRRLEEDDGCFAQGHTASEELSRGKRSGFLLPDSLFPWDTLPAGAPSPFHPHPHYCWRELPVLPPSSRCEWAQGKRKLPSCLGGAQAPAGHPQAVVTSVGDVEGPPSSLRET